MLSFDERELGRQMQQLAATIVVPPAPSIGRRGRVPLWPVLASLAVAVIVLATVAQLAPRGRDTLSPRSPAPGVIITPSPSPSPSPTPSPASPTPSHRATPYTGLPSSTFLATPGVTWTITGTITELGAQGQQPVAGAHISVYLYSSRRGGHWMTDVTEADGRYELWGIPTGAVAVLYAGKGATLQPCVHEVTVTNRTSLDIEIVPEAAGGAAASAAARRGTGPFLTGVVFEQLADGTSVPIPNAEVTIGGDMTPLGATTITDPDGRYLVCGIRGNNEFYVGATGFRKNSVREIDVSADMTLDVQMKR